jgi:tetratricopeptide (TPR) repeat protein
MSIQPRYRKGDRIGGRYLVHQGLMGGMGEVYLCLDLETNLPYALKTFQQRYLTNPHIRQLFAHEVGTWIALEKHPNIVRCFYMDTLDNQPFMKLEWVAGEEEKGIDLRSWLRRGPLDLRTALDFTIDICRGLVHAQEKLPGIVHRDLKPENILVSQRRLAKITDFGLATLVQQAGLELIADAGIARGRQTLIGASGVVGTPPYMAPELWRGERGDVRTDIYAVGCILYELLTGFLAYQANTLASFQSLHMKAPLPAITAADSLPSSLNSILAHCLAKALQERFADTTMLHDALTQLYRAQIGVEPRVMPIVGSFTLADYGNRGSTYDELGRFEAALADYNQAIALDPADARTHYNRGVTFAKLERYDDAVADYNQAIALNPADARTYVNRATTYLTLGQFADALDDVTQAIVLAPAYARAYYNRGIIYDKLERFEAALADYSQAITLNPADAHVYVNRGIIYDKLERFEAALADYSQAITLNPADAHAYGSRGVTYAKLGRFADALANYTNAIELDPTLAQVYTSRGFTYHKLGQVDDALADYTRAIAFNAADAMAYYNRGNIYAKQGRYGDALEDFNHAIELDPADAPAYVNRGNVYAKQGRFDEAIVDYNRAIKVAPTDADAYGRLGALLANQGKLREALPYFDQAAQLDHPQGAQYVGRVRQMLGMESANQSNPAQQAFDALQHATSRAVLQQAIAQFPFMTDPGFIAAVGKAIAEQVLPEHRPTFEQRLAWLREIADEQQ